MMTGDGLIAGIMVVSAIFFLRDHTKQIIVELRRIADALQRNSK